MVQYVDMLLVYGIGYTGALASRELHRQGVPHLVGNRSLGASLQAHAAAVGAETRAFDLADEAGLTRGLAGVTVVLNCAGPFTRTAAPLAAACLERGIHYLDLAGEVAEHEAVRALHDRALARGAMLLPGAGFGVVPTELAAARATAALGEPATHLVIAFETRGGASRGTLESVLRGIHEPGVERREGALVPVAPGARRRRLDLGGGRALVVTNPWRADLVSAAASTGAPAIETYSTFPAPARFFMRRPRLMRSRFGRWLVGRIIAGSPAGPSERDLARGSTRVLATATAADGRTASVRVRGPEAYVFTARAAAACARAALDGRARAGFAVPSQLLGLDGLSAIEGTSVEELA